MHFNVNRVLKHNFEIFLKDAKLYHDILKIPLYFTCFIKYKKMTSPNIHQGRNFFFNKLIY
jgi:hypothetical protein